MHEMMLTLMRRKLFLAPLEDSVGRVLDLGTGTGVWAMDFGEISQEKLRTILVPNHFTTYSRSIPSRRGNLS